MTSIASILIQLQNSEWPICVSLTRRFRLPTKPLKDKLTPEIRNKDYRYLPSRTSAIHDRDFVGLIEAWNLEPCKNMSTMASIACVSKQLKNRKKLTYMALTRILALKRHTLHSEMRNEIYCYLLLRTSAVHVRDFMNLTNRHRSFESR